MITKCGLTTTSDGFTVGHKNLHRGHCATHTQHDSLSLSRNREINKLVGGPEGSPH